MVYTTIPAIVIKMEIINTMFIFCFISIFLMLVETIGGLRSTIATTFGSKKNAPAQQEAITEA